MIDNDDEFWNQNLNETKWGENESDSENENENRRREVKSEQSEVENDQSEDDDDMPLANLMHKNSTPVKINDESDNGKNCLLIYLSRN